MARTHSDEAYIIGLCDCVIGTPSLRQHRFDFLTGDVGTRLPVDAYYPHHRLVIEYRERQHIEAVDHFDRRMTVSGVRRGEQRRLYDERRRTVLPRNGLQLIEYTFSDFQHNAARRLKRVLEADREVIAARLSQLGIGGVTGIVREERLAPPPAQRRVSRRTRDRFTPAEIARIRGLLRRKARAARNEQKRLRDQLRAMHFFISDFPHDSVRGFTEEDLDRIIGTGDICVSAS